jgi:hypothetical protein
MKKWIALFLLLGCTQVHADGWLTGGPDYSNQAPNEFYCADLSGTPVTTQAGLSATTPALTIYNPYGSGVNLTLLEVGADVTSSPAGAAGFSLAYSTGAPPSSTTSATVIPANFANIAVSTSTTINKAGCYRIATLANAPVAFRYLGGTTGASAISGFDMTDPTWGKVVIPPGIAVSFQATSAAAVVVDFLWREDPI